MRANPLPRRASGRRRRAPWQDAQSGDILLFYRAKGLSQIITWFSGSPFYHFGIYDGNGGEIAARLPGVVRRRLARGRHRLRCVVIPAPPGQGHMALDWAKQRLGENYASLGAVALVFDHLFERFGLDTSFTRRSYYTCGQFVVQTFNAADTCLFPDLDEGEVAPWDFASLLPGDGRSPR